MQNQGQVLLTLTVGLLVCIPVFGQQQMTKSVLIAQNSRMQSAVIEKANASGEIRKNKQLPIFDHDWEREAGKKIDDAVHFPFFINRKGVIAAVGFIVDKKGLVSNINARPLFSLAGLPPQFPGVEWFIIDAIKRTNLGVPSLPYEKFCVGYMMDGGKGRLSCLPVLPTDTINENGDLISDPNWATDEVKKIDNCLRFPKSLKAEDIKKFFRISFEINDDGSVSNFKPDRYNLETGLPKSIISAIEEVMVNAVKHSNIRAPRRLRGPYGIYYYIIDGKGDLSYQ